MTFSAGDGIDYSFVHGIGQQADEGVLAGDPRAQLVCGNRRLTRVQIDIGSAFELRENGRRKPTRDQNLWTSSSVYRRTCACLPVSVSQ